MEQRRLRLGDILDDYCPRERRVTNHAVVAMIEEDVKQTRCTTCDAEHVYKGGKAPRRRKKETTDALYKEVLAGMPDADGAPALAAPAGQLPPETAMTAETAASPLASIAPGETTATDNDPGNLDGLDGADPGTTGDVEEGPVHRALIRAQLPRIEGHKEERRLPDFTIRQNSGRGVNSHFRGGDARMKPRGAGAQGGGDGQGGTGHRPHGGTRFAGPRPAGAPGRGGPGRGGPAGFRGAGGPPRQGGGGGRKRSR